MNYPEINVHCIARSRLDEAEIYNWLDEIGAKSFELPTDSATDAEILVGIAAKRCYKSFEPGLNPNVSKVREDWADYLDNSAGACHVDVGD